jgi:hypothetical protein
MNDVIQKWKELDLQSMDLILCAGNSRASRGIAKFQQLTGAPKEAAEMTHVASVAIAVEYPYYTKDPDLLMVQESTTLNEFSGKKGVQENYFDKWLPNYDGRVWVRKLEFERDAKFHVTDKKFWKEHKDDPYESGIPGAFELFFCAMRLHRFIPWYTPMETKEIHCTELVSKRLIAHGLMNEDVSVNRLPPWMWVSRIIRYMHCDVGEMIRIK